MIPSAPVFSFKRGHHTCVFYRDDSTLLHVLVPYVIEGLHANEKCFLCQRSDLWQRLKDALGVAGVNVEREQRRGALECHTPAEVYGGTQTFDPKTTTSLVKSAVTEAVKSGFAGLRAAGDMSWAATPGSGCSRLLEYESLVNAYFPHSQALGICSYPVTRFTPEMLEQIFDAHRMCLQEPQSRSSHMVLSMHKDGVMMDVVADRTLPQTTVYYIAQKHGTTDVLGWGSALSVDEAISAVERLAATA